MFPWFEPSMIAIRPKLSVTLPPRRGWSSTPVGPGPKSCSFSLVLFVVAHLVIWDVGLREMLCLNIFKLFCFVFFLLDLHCMHTCLVCMAASRSTNVQCWSLGLKNGDAVTVAAPYCFGMNDSLSMGNFEYTCPKNNLPCTFETARGKIHSK